MSLKDIEEAYHRIKSVINRTPVMTSRMLWEITKASVYLKCENFQRAGSFKFRGAFNTICQLSSKQKKRGIITHSSGNHAQAVALAASILDIPATIVMPKDAPIIKVNATKGYGANVVLCDNSLESRVSTTKKLITEKNLVLVHPYDNENVIYGQGTAVYELIKEVGDLDIVIAPLGGGGLLSGTAIATKGLCSKAKVYGVEPSIADDAYRSIQAGYIIPSIYPETIADGLRTSLCERTFKIIQKYVDEIVGIVKAYTTRVGEGPLPTELLDKDGEYLQQKGHEFGTTTSRPRRCGWLDLVVVKHTCLISGVTKLAIMKLDVLNGLKTAKICTHYDLHGKKIDYFPASIEDVKQCKPVYKEFKGWDKIDEHSMKLTDLPKEAQVYLQFIEKELGIPISIVSIGPGRTETIEV